MEKGKGKERHKLNLHKWKRLWFSIYVVNNLMHHCMVYVFERADLIGSKIIILL